ncbi:Mrp/NBP35 family ATP-binding protein [Alicyclobacillus cycloheptanicus]|uniref:Iron-sulfur cluster carrier protein n=1 Tax=Alicyclobacillus cycloheptanicus TaxID=1457 RepID=A0ABT9XJE5_9BACL|nr:Mrp/NBP35 family ATP-binding protein [Alicyclobacillus cycloheptanicus]MDQ0190439.1 ATP-binding protein involved in chromosome partitioning [Alicyclobacillus cycloheptanicus]WDM02678.1 Mrp/NBP35 family ATP-binding protein [Alicyclobacillus cycloheptanicus]
MITREQVLEVLRDVEDPEIHKSIVELEMVKDIDIRGSHVSVEVLLTIRGCPLHTTIENAVREKLLALDGVETVDVKIGHMNDEERAKFTSKLRGRPEPQSVPPILAPDSGIQFIAVASGKGGVGKSTVTANLAKAMAAQGLRVGIIDADIYGFSIPGIFGVKTKRPTVIDDLIIPIEVAGVKLISMHFFVPDNSPVVWRGPMLGKMLRNFFGEVHWGDLDVVLLDLPPGTGDIAMDVHQLLPKSKEIIVTTPQAGASDVAVRAGVMGMRTNHEIIGVVENMSYLECGHCGERTYVFGRGGGERVASELRTELLAQIPLANMDEQATPLFEEGTRQAEVFHALAQKIVDKTGLGQAVAAESRTS